MFEAWYFIQKDNGKTKVKTNSQNYVRDNSIWLFLYGAFKIIKKIIKFYNIGGKMIRVVIHNNFMANYL